MSLRVDAHQHLWDLTVVPQPWVNDEMAAIDRSFSADDLAQVVDGIVDYTVIVQTASCEAETLWMLEQASCSSHISGVVGWVDLTAENVADRLAYVRDSENGGLLRGVRHQVHDEVDVNWLRRSDVQRGIAAVGEAGLVYDLLLFPDHIGSAIDACKACPDVEFVIDHLAKPRIARGDLKSWYSELAPLAALDNVSCKFSGMVTEADWENWDVEQLRPYAESVLGLFGVERLMFGSDWPVCLLAASYRNVFDTANELLAGLSIGEQSWVLGATANRVYKLGLET